MTTALGSVQNSREKSPPSRPQPESPTPPNGAGRSRTKKQLTHTVPARSAAETRWARDRGSTSRRRRRGRRRRNQVRALAAQLEADRGQVGRQRRAGAVGAVAVEDVEHAGRDTGLEGPESIGGACPVASRAWSAKKRKLA